MNIWKSLTPSIIYTASCNIREKRTSDDSSATPYIIEVYIAVVFSFT